MGVSKNRVPQNGCFIVENPIKMDDLGIPLFLETPTCFVVDFLGGLSSCKKAPKGEFFKKHPNFPRKLQHTPLSHTRSAIPLANYERNPMFKSLKG